MNKIKFKIILSTFLGSTLLGWGVIADEQPLKVPVGDALLDSLQNYYQDSTESQQQFADDIVIEGRRAERVIREAEILMSDINLQHDHIVYRHLLVIYQENLYACLHIFAGLEGVSVLCSREGDER